MCIWLIRLLTTILSTDSKSECHNCSITFNWYVTIYLFWKKKTFIKRRKFIHSSPLKWFVKENFRIKVCGCEVHSSPQTIDDLILRETRLNMTNCHWVRVVIRVQSRAPLHQVHHKRVVDSLGPDETVGVVEGEDVGVGSPTQDVTRLYLLVSAPSRERREFGLLTGLARPHGNPDSNVASVRDERPTGEFSGIFRYENYRTLSHLNWHSCLAVKVKEADCPGSMLIFLQFSSRKLFS